ncbi:MAG TPA: glycoside hydrolase family 172 protein, partial [Clostridia bacterium]|nr:glycoside hydrolase family 172 protein [Clostridia bacterium]
DGDGVIRKEGGKLVLAEMEGPGCIYRIWSATPQNGHVRIYLDGANEPAVDLPFTGYFDGKNAPFTRPSLVHTVARGWNNYTPIPYQKSCKIVADEGWGLYYQFNYITFPKGTKVPTFKRQLTAEENAALDKADRLLTRCGPTDSGEKPAKAARVSLAPEAKTVEQFTLKGPAAITGLRVRMGTLAPSEIEALRSAVIQIRWDGEAEPSVWAPLGDFFGTAPGANYYQSLPMGLGRDGWWYCNWVMPFARKAEVSFVHEGTAGISFEYEVFTKKLNNLDKYGRFHAKWHRDAFLPLETERWIDWPIVKTEGAGRFVGVALHIWNPRGGWWGEGDEKFFVDGEKFPSTIGTGSEDYFGYAWCDPGLFQNAFHNQTRNDGNNKGHVSVNRWQVAENIPFHRSFDGYIEKYYPNQRPTLYAATAYWYLAPGGKDPYRPVPLAQRVNYWVPAQTQKVKGAIEGESLAVASKTAGVTQEQDMSGFGDQWSNDAHLWWTQAKPGDQLELALPVAAAGNYELKMQMTKAPDYGIIQLYLDGQKLGEPIDLYHSGVVPTKMVSFGTHQLSRGQHKLVAEVVGANPKAIQAHMFGLDYVVLEPK